MTAEHTRHTPTEQEIVNYGVRVAYWVMGWQQHRELCYGFAYKCSIGKRGGRHIHIFTDGGKFVTRSANDVRYIWGWKPQRVHNTFYGWKQ